MLMTCKMVNGFNNLEVIEGSHGCEQLRACCLNIL
jgi:hypothetical protein